MQVFLTECLRGMVGGAVRTLKMVMSKERLLVSQKLGL